MACFLFCLLRFRFCFTWSRLLPCRSLLSKIPRIQCRGTATATSSSMSNNVLDGLKRGGVSAKNGLGMFLKQVKLSVSTWFFFKKKKRKEINPWLEPVLALLQAFGLTLSDLLVVCARKYVLVACQFPSMWFLVPFVFSNVGSVGCSIATTTQDDPTTSMDRPAPRGCAVDWQPTSSGHCEKGKGEVREMVLVLVLVLVDATMQRCNNPVTQSVTQ
ncbi:hypothetical protein V8C37DRAFT_395521 [Trichoderma ceciliae]